MCHKENFQFAMKSLINKLQSLKDIGVVGVKQNKGEGMREERSGRPGEWGGRKGGGGGS